MLLGEMSTEELLVDADAFDPLGPLAGLAVHNPVYQSEGIPVGQQGSNLIGI